MTDYYSDINTGSAVNGGTSWADAMDTIENLLAKMAAGDRGFIMAGTDTSASDRVLTSPADDVDGIMLFGCKTGTTAEPPTASDLSIRGTDTLPLIQGTSTATITIANGFHAHGLRFEVNGAVISHQATGNKAALYRCEIDSGGSNYRPGNNQNTTRHYDCKIMGSVVQITGHGTDIEFIGGEITVTNADYCIAQATQNTNVTFRGVDFSGSTSANVFEGGAYNGKFHAVNCKLKTGHGLTNTQTSVPSGFVEMIGCTDGVSKGNTESYQEYQSERVEGTVDSEAVAVRTGGADDGASGLFSLALTPFANETREGVSSVETPWFSVWVPGGSSKTLTVYIANSGAGDYNEDDVWCEFLTPDAGDSAQHDYNIKTSIPGLFLGGAAPITDDASTWGTGAANAQKFSVTVTPGFEGLAQARVHFSKRFTSTPEILFVDPLIVVT